MHLFVRPFCFLVKLSYYDRKKGARKTFQSETVKGDISKKEAFRKTGFLNKKVKYSKIVESLHFYGFSVIIISYRVEQNIHMEEHMLELQNICYQVNDEDGDKRNLTQCQFENR